MRAVAERELVFLRSGLAGKICGGIAKAGEQPIWEHHRGPGRHRRAVGAAVRGRRHVRQDYWCRNGFFSLNVQAICDANYEFW